MAASPRPGPGTQFVAHAIVGIGTVAVTAKVLGKQAGAAIVTGILAILAHAWFDAPVAKFLAELGFNF